MDFFFQSKFFKYATYFILITFLYSCTPKNLDSLHDVRTSTLSRNISLSLDTKNGVYGVSPNKVVVFQSPEQANKKTSAVYRQRGSETDSLFLDSIEIPQLIEDTNLDIAIYEDYNDLDTTQEPIFQNTVRTWKSFKNVKLSLNLDSESDDRINISWKYSPWDDLPALNIENIKARCRFTSNASTAALNKEIEVEDLAKKESISTTFSELGLTGEITARCEIEYSDKTISTSISKLTFKGAPSYSKCDQNAIKQDEIFSCDLSLETDEVSNQGFEIIKDQTTCQFLKIENGTRLFGTPNDNQVGTCNYAIKELGSKGLPLVQSLEVLNLPPVFQNKFKTKNMIERNDFSLNKISNDLPEVELKLAISNLVLGDLEVETNEEESSKGIGYPLGDYRETKIGVSKPCSDFGLVQISAQSGEVRFDPDENFYGNCSIGILYDDKNNTDKSSVTQIVEVIVRTINDAPEIKFTQNSKQINCGSKCFVDIDYEFAFDVNTGGKRYPETSQKLEIHCKHKDPNSAKYLILADCSFSPDGNQLILTVIPSRDPNQDGLIDFNPSIVVSVRDNGKNELLSGIVSKPLESEVIELSFELEKFQQLIEPALVVAKGGCLMCHAQVKGDIITDFSRNSEASSRYQHDRANSYVRLDDSIENPFFFPSLLPTYGTISNRLDGWNAISILTGKLYVEDYKLPSHMTSGLSNQGTGTLFIDQNKVTTLKDLLSRSDVIVNKDATPLGQTYVRIGGKNVTPDKISDEVSGRKIEKLAIRFPLSKDIESIDTKRLIDWNHDDAVDVKPLYRVSPDREFEGLITSHAPIPGITKTGVTPGLNYITNVKLIKDKSGKITSVDNQFKCFGDVIVKGPLLLVGADLITGKKLQCRLYVDGPVYIVGSEYMPYKNSIGTPYAISINASLPEKGLLQISSTDGIAIGISPERMAYWFGSESEITLTAKKLGLSSDLDGCSTYVPIANIPTDSVARFASYPESDKHPDHKIVTSYCAAIQIPVPVSGAFIEKKDYALEGVILNSYAIIGRYGGGIKGSVITDLSLMRIGNLVYEYDSDLDEVVPFPRFRQINTTERPNGLNIFEIKLKDSLKH